MITKWIKGPTVIHGLFLHSVTLTMGPRDRPRYEYVKCTCVHTMFINIYRNPKTRNWFRYETFYYLFEFKVFWLEERERHNFFLCWPFHLTPTTASSKIDLLVRSLNLNSTNALASYRPKLVLPRWAQKINLPRLSLKLNLPFFFKFPKSSALPGMTSFPIWGFYCDISDCHIRPARALTPALN